MPFPFVLVCCTATIIASNSRSCLSAGDAWESDSETGASEEIGWREFEAVEGDVDMLGHIVEDGGIDVAALARSTRDHSLLTLLSFLNAPSDLLLM